MTTFDRATTSAGALRRRARALVIACLAIAAAALSASPAASQGADPYNFEKKAYKPDGTAWTGPVTVGDIVKYVLSYKPGTTKSGPATIVDTLSPNQTYVAPTKASDSGWTWGTAPYSTGNAETYSHPGFGPGTVKVTVVGPSTAPLAGDGTIPVPVLSLNKVFGVYHHVPIATNLPSAIDCWYLDSLGKCPGYPKTTSTGSYIIITPITPQAVVRGTKVFFVGLRGATLTSTTGIPTIACFDGATDTACPDTTLDPSLTGTMVSVNGLVEDNIGRVFAAVNDKVFCRVLVSGAWANCPAWPAAGLVSITTPTSPLYNQNLIYVSMEYGPSPTRLYIHHGDGYVQCIDTNLLAPCAGSWTPAGTKIGTLNKGVMFSSLPLSGSSGDGGVCLWSLSGAQLGCLDNLGAAISSTPANVVNIAISSFRLPNSGKVFFPSYNPPGSPKCFDYSGSSGVACPGFTIPVPPLGGITYGFALDPRDPTKCMLTLGHNNVLWRFDYNTGETGEMACGTSGIKTPKIEDIYCTGAPNPAAFQWNEIRILTPLANGTLTITQGTGTPVTQAVTSGTTIYPMPAGIGPGYGQLSFTYAPTPGSPTTVELEIGYVSDKNPEICYQAEVKCGPVFNTAVFESSFDGAAVNVSRNVDLGPAVGPDCNPPPPEATSCLNAGAEVACGKKPGTYVVTLKPRGAGGVIPDTVDITSLTPGVTLMPAKPSYPVKGGEVKVTLAGASPGDVVELQVSGTTLGGGSAAGSDLCCNGKIEITIPKDLACAEPPVVEVEKICDPATEVTGEQGGPAIQGQTEQRFEAKCRIIVSSTGPVSGPLTISDVLGPAGSGGAVTAMSSAQPWVCAPTPPVPAGTAIGCAMNGSDLNAAGGTSIIDVLVAVGSAPDGEDAKQCARLKLGDKDVDEACTGLKLPPPVEVPPTLEVTKTCGPATAGAKGFEADCKITVTATGSPLPQTIQIIDRLMGPGNVAGFHNEIVSMTSTENWACPAMPVNVGIDIPCRLPGADLAAAGGRSVIDVKVHFPDAGNARESQQCVEAEARDAAGTAVLAAPQTCVKFAAAPPVVAPKCDPRTTALVGGACRCTIAGMVPVSKTMCGCSEGMELRGGKCVTPPPACKDGARFSPQRQRCEPICRADAKYDSKRNACITPPPACKDGTRFSPQRQRCEPICSKREQYDAKRNVCVTPPPACKDGARFNPQRQRCEPICRADTEYDSKRNACITPPPACKNGARFSPQRQRCEPICRADAKYDSKRNACVMPPPACKNGTQFSPRRQRCEPICSKREQYDAKQNVCVDKRQKPSVEPKQCKDRKTGAVIACR